MNTNEFYFEANRNRWNQKTRMHMQSRFYDNQSFLSGRNTLNPIERKGLGDIAGKTVLHLQCHFGQDSLSMSRMGAKVTGIDISDESINQARTMNDSLNLDARFIRCNVYDVPQYLNDTFDLVFTSYGAICWLPDLELWFEVIHHLLKAGGIFYMVEFHPVLYMFEFDEKILKYHYFNKERYSQAPAESYTDGPSRLEGTEFFWNHSVTEILQPFINPHYEILQFAEYDYSPYNCFENMIKRSEGEYVYDVPVSVPHLFELKVRKRN